jgi:hypothetical protein
VPYDLWKKVFIKPKRGRWTVHTDDDSLSGLYMNGSGQRFTVYMKDEHLRKARQIIPPEVDRECDHGGLLRMELRMDKAVRASLRNKGFWTLGSLIGADLHSEIGFLAFLRYFDWRLHQFVIREETPELSVRDKLILSTSLDLIKFWKKQVRQGKVTEEMLSAAKQEIDKMGAILRPQQLLKDVDEECNLQYERYDRTIPINGKFRKEELIKYAGSKSLIT